MGARMITPRQTPTPRLYARTLIDATLSVYCYILLEWMFFVTKPSFFSVLNWPDRVSIALTTALPSLALAITAWFLLAVIGRALSMVTSRPIAKFLLPVPLTIVLTVLVTLLIDNFAYTVFGFGIVSTSGALSILYLACIIAVALLIYRKLLRRYSDPRLTPSRASSASLLVLTVLSCGCALYSTYTSSGVSQVAVDSSSSKPRFNVLLFASDGIQSEYISGYGFREQTTPHLDAMMTDSMVFEAAISNSGRTTGSTVAMLNGKYPTTTKVIFPPQTLIGLDAFQHLPGILRASGYRVFQETVRYYADGPDLNMQGGFDYANQRTVAEDSWNWMPGRVRLAQAQSIHFYDQMKQRVVERALHLAGLQPMNRAFKAVTGGSNARVYGRSDRDRIDSAVSFIRKSKQPFLMHIHLMNTHCCSFSPVSRHFSGKHEEQTRENRKDFFLDTVVDSDGYFGELIDALKAAGKYENTLIVYSSDHTLGWRVRKTMPLVVRLPGSKGAQRIKSNVQLIDVAPTVLDVLRLPVPRWMEGISLLDSERDSLRPAFSVDGIARERVEGNKALSQLIGAGPPVYGVKTVVVTVCQRSYSLNLVTGKLTMETLKNHPRPCKRQDLPNMEEGRQMLVEHLTNRGFTMPSGASDVRKRS